MGAHRDFFRVPLKSSDELRILVFLLLTINSFNLLPLLPLDGGRILSQVLFSRRPILELVFGVLTGGMLVLLALAGRSWWLGCVGGLVILNSLRGHRLSHAAQGLRGTLHWALPPRTSGARLRCFATGQETVAPHHEAAPHGDVTVG